MSVNDTIAAKVLDALRKLKTLDDLDGTLKDMIEWEIEMHNPEAYGNMTESESESQIVHVWERLRGAL